MNLYLLSSDEEDPEDAESEFEPSGSEEVCIHLYIYI